MTSKRLNLFPTPVVVDQLDDADTLNRELEATIRSQMSDDPGVQRSNFGGWHSDSDLLDWGGPAARRLADHALALATANTKTVRGGDLQWRIQAWANVFGKGAGNAAHIHGGNYWAAVYYVRVGDGEGGRLRLHDPRAPALRMHAPLLRFTNAGRELMHPIVPVAGQMVLFPAWLMHSVEPWDGDGERISIAMNIRSVRKRTNRLSTEVGSR